MFIPRGKPLHENLATSYVLLDALVDDLCEGGFSGIVEVTLRHLDGHVIMDAGSVAAVIESRDTGRDVVSTVDSLASKARRERGRVSVYGLSSPLASTVARRIGAEALYTQLSTEFADLEKMVYKLSRERDRRWFIEVRTGSGLEALIHIREGLFQVATAEHEASSPGADNIDIAGNVVLRGLLEECNRVGGVFDVYFKSAFEPVRPVQAEPEPERVELTGSLAATAAPGEIPAGSFPEEKPQSYPEFTPVEVESGPYEEARMALFADAEKLSLAADLPLRATATAGVGAEGGIVTDAFDARSAPVEEPPIEEIEAAGEDEPEPSIKSKLRSALEGASEDEVMADIKRLMGDIAQTIEEATTAVEQRDSFPMYLRAGQLKIADRYPFLDPFGAEFEYLGGEIAFIGKAGPVDFVEGLTSALRLAVTSVIQTGTQPPRVRARVSEELSRLVDRNRAEFERFGLDRAVEQILSEV